MSNLAWILDHGLVCQNSPIKDPDFRSIGSADVIGKREHREVPIPPGGTLADYVPFYFTPLSIMMFNIVTGHRDVQQIPPGDLVVLASSLPAIEKAGGQFLFTDSHALLSTARFSSALADLPVLVDWKLLQDRDFRRDPDDPGKGARYQAEALVHGSLPVHGLTGIACSAVNQAATLEALVSGRGLDLKVIARPEWFFQ
jgi:hypothetical protein